MTKIVLTGVSRGLGRAMAEGFAEAGCQVLGCARSGDAIGELRESLPATHRFDCVDVASDVAIAAWATELIQDYGPPDILVNNAAVINDNAPLWDISSHEFDLLTSVNINGTANTIRHFVPSMVQRQSGVVVNFSSGWGRSVSAQVAPYCATKWAVEGLTRALAEELPTGMAAVPLNPGVINTEMLQNCFGGGSEMYPSASEWATRAVPFILSLTSADNGQPLTVPD